MKMQKRNFRIGELADHLAIERFVIRFWEKEFNIKGQRSDGGQRFYTEKDIQKFEAIKGLLYDHGFTIAGAKKHLKENGTKKVNAPIRASHITTMEQQEHKTPEQPSPIVEKVTEQQRCTSDMSPEVAQQILALQQKLMLLKELL